MGVFPFFFSYGNYHVVMEFEQQMPLNCDQIFMAKFKTYVAECVASIVMAVGKYMR